RKCRTRGSLVRLCPKTTVMSLDDRAADKQSDAHAAALRGAEGIEQRAEALQRQSHTRIAHRQANIVALRLSLGLDQQLPRSILHVRHRFQAIAEEIQNDLLELNPIAGDEREIIRKLRLKNDAISLKLLSRQRDEFSDRLVQVQRLERELP